jgi:pimeloyl-ACP methyl ester carboxylesterase
MVLIHGSWGDHDNWARVVPGLSENFRILTYDRRGHSMSQKTTTQGSVEEDATDVQALLTRLGLAPAHVVGNSYGAHIALTLATKQPSVFKSLIVHEPPLFDLLMGDPSEAIATEGRKRAKAVIKLLENGDKVGGARLFVETLAFGPGQWEKLTPKLKETFINNADTWLDETRDPVGLKVELKALSLFRAPAMLSYGGKSPPFFRPIVEKLAKTLPGSKVETYLDDGHTPHMSNPVEFVRKVTGFARSIIV